MAVLRAVAVALVASSASGGGDQRLNQYESAAGFYYPLNASVPGNVSMRDAFKFGANAVRMVADPGYGGWPWAEAVAQLCNSSSQVYAAVLPPSEGAMENNPADCDPNHPAEHPGMVQAAQRMSNLSKTCPQVAGIIIDDFCQHADPERPRQRCHKVSEAGMEDIKSALLGKPVDPRTGKVNRTGLATTPHLKLWVVLYDQQLALNYSIAPRQLAVIDGLSLWQNQQPLTGSDAGTRAMLSAAAARWPAHRLQSGTVLAFSSFGWAPVQTVRDVLTTSLQALRRGDIDNALLLDANDLRVGVINSSHWRALAIPALLEQELWRYMGAGIVQLRPGTGAVVTVSRIVHGREIIVTSKRTNEGSIRFGGFAGVHKVVVQLDDGSRAVDKEMEVVAQATTVLHVDAAAQTHRRRAQLAVQMSWDGAGDKALLLAVQVAATPAGSRVATWTLKSEPCAAGWDSYNAGWLGVQCDGQGPSHRIVLVNLAMSGVGGNALLPLLGRLSELRILNLRNNEELKGNIADLSNLAELRGLTLRNTAIGGAVEVLAACSHLGEQGWALFPGDRLRGGGVALGRTLVHGDVGPLRSLPGLGTAWGGHWQDFTPCSGFEPICVAAGLRAVSNAQNTAGTDECACCASSPSVRAASTDICISPQGECDCGSHGRCRDGGDGCDCEPGYSGAACETRDAPDSCNTVHEFQLQILPVNAECCDEPTEDCSSSDPDQPGYPAVCNAGCQRLLLPMKTACAAFLAAHPPIQAAVDGAAANCHICTSFEQYADLLVLASAKCCDGPSGDCSSGVPVGGCDVECSAALSNLLVACEEYLSTQPVVLAQLRSAAASCVGNGH